MSRTLPKKPPGQRAVPHRPPRFGGVRSKTARDLLAALLDAGTYHSWDRAPVDVRPGPGYATELARARAATGLDESVCTGEGLLGGRRVAVAVSEFGFLGGSIGVAAAERLTLATADDEASRRSRRQRKYRQLGAPSSA